MDKLFLTGHQDFDLSRKLVRDIYRTGFFPDVIIGIWKGGTPAAITVHDSFEALARFHGFSEPRYHNAVRAEADGSIDIKNMGSVLDEVADNDRVLVVGNVYKGGRTIDAIIAGLRSNGRRNLDIRSAVQVFRREDSGTSERSSPRPDYFAMETDAHVVFPYQMDHLSDDEIEQHRPEVAGFLLRDRSMIVPSSPPGVIDGARLFVLDNHLYPMARELALKAYLDGVRPSYLVGVWRGGTPIGITMYDVFCALARRKGFQEPGYHNVVKAKSYDDEGKAGRVTVKNLDAVLGRISPADSVLLCEDVFERGLTSVALRAPLREQGFPHSFYVLFYKPHKNETGTTPDGSLYTTDMWVVMPHETREWMPRSREKLLKPENLGPLVKYRCELAPLFLQGVPHQGSAPVQRRLSP